MKNPRKSPRFFFGASAEVSALLGRIPSAVGYQPTLATDLASLQDVGKRWGGVTEVFMLIIINIIPHYTTI